MERNEAQKKFWALFLLWVIILMVWLGSTRSGNSDSTLSSTMILISYILLGLLLGLIVLVTVYEYLRRTRPVKDAKYMMVTKCEGRDRMNPKGTGNLFQGYYVSYLKPDKRTSGWVQTTADFYDQCTIGTPVLIISADQSDTSKMRAFDPATFEI